MIERFERFSFSVFEISRHWHRLAAEEMEKYGLKGAHAMYLIVMYRYPEGIPAARLGELCGRDKADVSRMIAALERKGMICRDEKVYRGMLRLTQAGCAAAQIVRERAAVAVEIAGSGLSEDDRRVFYKALEHITGNLRRLSREGIPSEKKEI